MDEIEYEDVTLRLPKGLKESVQAEVEEWGGKDTLSSVAARVLRDWVES